MAKPSYPWTDYILDARTVLESAYAHAPSAAERAGLERAILQLDRLLLVAAAYRPDESYYQQDCRPS